MFHSKNHSLLFIAAPKTGSTSVESCLSEIIQDGTRFRIDLPDKTITSADVSSPSLGHAKAIEFKDVLGATSYNSLFVFGFVRDPIEKVVSSYFFTRSGKLRDAFSIRTEKSKPIMVIRQVISILAARILPLWLWSLMYKMRDCHSYFTDNEGSIIVDCLGSTNRLSLDLLAILDQCGIEVPEQLVPHTNTSVHRRPEDYWFFRFWIPLLRKRYAADLALFRLVKDGIWVNSKGAAAGSREKARAT